VQGTDVNTAANDVSASINRIVGRLPSTVGTPTIFKADPNASPIMNLALTGGTLAALYDTATNQLQPSLQQAAGVAAVQVQGGLIPQVNVTINPSALASYGVSVNQITQALGQQNVSIPGGTTNVSGTVVDVRTDAYFQSVGELKNLVVASPGSTPVTLGQVATVTQGYAPIDQQTRLNGQDSVGLVITAQSGANVVAVDTAVKARLTQLELALPPGMHVAIVNDQTDYINQSLKAVENDLALAVILPAIVLLVFLHRIRNMFIVVLAIPTSLLSTFTVMYFTGFSLDLISLLALSLLTGILVDDSVVVLENINRHLAMGKHPIRAALDGRHEIALAAVTITLTDVVVYLPVAFTNGLVGQIFREFGITIVAATLFSLLHRLHPDHAACLALASRRAWTTNIRRQAMGAVRSPALGVSGNGAFPECAMATAGCWAAPCELGRSSSSSAWPPWSPASPSYRSGCWVPSSLPRRTTHSSR